MIHPDDHPDVQAHIADLDTQADDRADRARHNHQANRAAKARRIAEALSPLIGPGTDAGLDHRQIAVLAETRMDPENWARIATLIGEQPPTTATQCLVVSHLRAMHAATASGTVSLAGARDELTAAMGRLARSAP